MRTVLRPEGFQCRSERRRYSATNSECRGLLLALDVVGGIVARADAVEHVAGAAPGLRQLHLAMPGGDDAAAPSLDAGLHDPDLAARRVDAQAEAGQCLVEHPISCAQRGNSVVDLISSMDSREVMLKIFTCEMSDW